MWYLSLVTVADLFDGIGFYESLWVGFVGFLQIPLHLEGSHGVVTFVGKDTQKKE